MTTEQEVKYQREREWRETDLGKLFTRYEGALGIAWATDRRESATKASMDRDWGRAHKARDALLLAIRGW